MTMPLAREEAPVPGTFWAFALVLGVAGLGWAALVADAARDGFGLDALLAATCRPASALGGTGMSGLAASAGVWVAMAMATMLPGGLPLISGYANASARARASGFPAPGAGWIALGFGGVWAAAGVVAAVLQAGVVALAGGLPGWAGSLALGLGILGVGLYQFTPVKRACLAACRDTSPVTFSDWSPRRANVLRAGVLQGRASLGCCWAIMALLALTGSMSLAAMALASILSTLEKATTGAGVTRVIGFGSLALGAAVLAGVVRLG